MIRDKKSLQLYCFSPPVMLATFLIEISFAIYIVWRYHMNKVSRLVVSILVCLGIFQAAEYMLCGGLGVQGGTWSQVGYSAITMLPPLGVHLVLSLAGKKNPALIGAAYMSAIFFVGYFAFMSGAISGHTCYANYAVFDTSQGFIPSFFYGLYYYGWLFVGVGLAMIYAQRSTIPAQRRALFALAFGYSAFIVPTTAFNLIDPSTISGIPSIMCGFAVILAFALMLKVVPDSVELKENNQPLKLKLPF